MSMFVAAVVVVSVPLLVSLPVHCSAVVTGTALKSMAPVLVRSPFAQTANGAADASNGVAVVPSPIVTSVLAELRTVALAGPVSLSVGGVQVDSCRCRRRR